MAISIPFPLHLTEEDIKLSDALRINETHQHQLGNSEESIFSEQNVLTQQLFRQLLTLSVGTGCVDPNTELVWIPEEGFIPQERYL